MKSSTFFALLLSAILAGCAHPIAISPSTAKLETQSNVARIKADVGLFISPQNLSLEVTTPGGGGDNVRYFPYRDMDGAFFRMLISVYEGVTRAAGETGTTSTASTSNPKFTITPELVTNSGSTGFFTWPPTNFTVDLTSKIRDSKGALVASPRVIGTAQVGGISEMNGDHGVTGRRAMEDALIKMQAALRETKLPGVGDTAAGSLKP